MPVHDFKCRHCDAVRSDMYYASGKCPKDNRLGCLECGKRRCMLQLYSLGKGMVSKTAVNEGQMSELGYGRYHPQLGFVLRDYNHKKEVMKRYNMIETNDPDGGNRKWSEEDHHDESQPDPDSASDVVWGSDYESIKNEMKNPKYHRGQGVTVEGDE